MQGLTSTSDDAGPRSGAGDTGRAAVLALVTGGAVAGMGPPFYASFASFLSLTLLMGALLVGSRGRASRAFVIGLIAGTTANALAMYWIVGLLQTFAGFPLVAAIPTAGLAWAAQGLIFAVASAGAVLLAPRGLPLWIGLPVCTCVSFSAVPALFPWRPSVGQLSFLPWAQLAEVGGEPLLDLLWGLVGTGLAQAALRRRLLPLAAGAACIVIPALYGLVRLTAIEAQRAAAPSLRVGIVQPNISMEAKQDHSLRRENLRLLQDETRRLEQDGAEVVIWPESSYPFALDRRQSADLRSAGSVRGRGVRGPVIFGALTVQGMCDRWNSAVAMDESGNIRGVADKVRLLAFGEYVPLWHWLPPLQERFRCPGFLAGRGPQPVEVGGARFGLLNCYEDILADEARRVMEGQPQLLVNLTNDAWFGDSTEPHIHHLLARMRTIETRRDLIRAVNTGVSGHVAATGREIQRTATWTRASFVTEARLLQGTTPWAALGDLTTPGLFGLLLGATWQARIRRGRARTRASRGA